MKMHIFLFMQVVTSTLSAGTKSGLLFGILDKCIGYLLKYHMAVKDRIHQTCES